MSEVRRAFALILLFLLIFFWFGLTLAKTVNDENRSEPVSATKMDFDVFIGEKRIGRHSFIFESGSNGTKVQSMASFDYKLFNISIYSYKHSSEETYDSHYCLKNINSTTQTRTKLRGSVSQSVSGARKQNVFWIKEPKKHQINKKCLMTFAYWTPKILHQKSLLNAQTGVEVPITVQKLAAQKSGSIYFLQADNLGIEIHYSNEGSWLSLNSKSTKTRALKYVLTRTNLPLQTY